MSFTANQVLDITVQDSEGVTKGVLTGMVKMAAGDGIEVETDGDTLTISAGTRFSNPNSKYRQKYRVIIEGGTWIDPDDGTVYGPFSGMPYYIASVSGTRGNFVRNYDFLSNACGQVGIVDPANGSLGSLGLDDLFPPAAGSGGSSEPLPTLAPGDQIASLLNVDGELELLDICQACIDCADYAQIIELMERIEEFQDWDVKRNLDDAGAGGELALFHQYQASVHYWNYLVHNQCIPLRVIRGNEHQDHLGEIWSFYAINTGYFLKDCVDLTDIKQKQTINVNWAGDAGDLKILFTNIIKKPETLPDPTLDVVRISDSVYEALIDYPDMSYNEYVMFQLSVRGTEEITSIGVNSEWCNTHITIPIGQSLDPAGDQCVTRGAGA